MKTGQSSLNPNAGKSCESDLHASHAAAIDDLDDESYRDLASEYKVDENLLQLESSQQCAPPIDLSFVDLLTRASSGSEDELKITSKEQLDSVATTTDFLTEDPPDFQVCCNCKGHCLTSECTCYNAQSFCEKTCGAGAQECKNILNIESLVDITLEYPEHEKGGSVSETTSGTKRARLDESSHSHLGTTLLSYVDRFPATIKAMTDGYSDLEKLNHKLTHKAQGLAKQVEDLKEELAHFEGTKKELQFFRTKYKEYAELWDEKNSIHLREIEALKQMHERKAEESYKTGYQDGFDVGSAGLQMFKSSEELKKASSKEGVETDVGSG